MAKIYPELLYPNMREDAVKTGEKKVYDAFKNKLPDPFVGFFSVEWLLKKDKETCPDIIDPLYRHEKIKPIAMGEIDFLIIHPGKGILVIEVKGGRIELIDGRWYSTDGKDTLYEIKDPIRQARRNYFALFQSLSKIPRFRNRKFQSGYGILFPDMKSPHQSFGVLVYEEITGFAEDLENPENKISSMMYFWEKLWGKTYPGKAKQLKLDQTDMDTIIKALAPTVKIKKPSIGSRIEEYKKQIFELTEEQFSLLKFLSQTRKALISGGAGTGKTMLAYEKAKQLSRQGFQTLLTCPNRFLAEFLARHSEREENITVLHFHQFCYRWGKRAGFKELIDPDGPRQLELSQGYFDKTLPETLLSALDQIPERFDAVIVDEGQDMRTEWWDYLQLCMRDPEEGIFYIFYDQHQNIWYKDTRLPFNIEPITLTKNLRNNRKIHSLLSTFFDFHSYEPGGPEEGDVNFIALENDGEKLMAQALRELLDKLVVKEKISRSDIAILTGRSKSDSKLAGLKNLGKYDLVDSFSNDQQGIFFSSIRRFRGMEKPVVILIELEELVEPAKLSETLKGRLQCSPQDIPEIARETLYIGLSRAQSFIYIMGLQETISALESLMEN